MAKIAEPMVIPISNEIPSKSPNVFFNCVKIFFIPTSVSMEIYLTIRMRPKLNNGKR